MTGRGSAERRVTIALVVGIVLVSFGGLAAHAQAPAGAQPSAVQPAQGVAAAAPAGVCSKADFEVVVDQAASSLRQLNNKNRPAFQDKLRLLKEKRGWTDDQFLVEATPFVKDDEIEQYDGKTNDLLGQISSMGEEGATAAVPDCALLGVLRGYMQDLVDTQVAKWDYMGRKISEALK